MDKILTFIVNEKNDSTIILNEENIDYEWSDIDKFIEKINWFGDKKILRLVLNKALQGEIYFKEEYTEKIV